MNKIAGLAVLGAGIVLLVFGLNESHSFSSNLSRTFTGNPTNHSMWLIVGGVAAIVVGVVATLGGRGKS